MTLKLESQIEAILFHKAEAVTIGQLAKWLAISAEAVETGLNQLTVSLAERGVRLIRQGKEITLGTASEASSLVEQVTKDDLSRDLSKAMLETLTLVVYEGPLSRVEIDYVRGVNSSSILRHLLVRGLIERDIDQKDARRFIYRPTLELLRYLGIEKVENLPEYKETRKQINDFLINNEKID